VLIGAAAGVAIAFATRSPEPQTPSGTSTTTPQALFNDAVNATRTAAGFHYVSHSTGSEPQTFVGDAGPSGGRQVITFDSTYGTEQFTLLLVSGIVYFQGNTPALEDQLGVAASSAPALQSKWVSVSQGDGPYSVLEPGITVSDQASELLLDPAAASRVTTQNGVDAYRITGSVPAQQGGVTGTAHLDITSATHQPLTYVTAELVGGVSLTSTTTFSGWGTAPTVTAPSGTVAWSTLGATEPPGGYGQGGTGGGTGGGTATPSPTGSTI